MTDFVFNVSKGRIAYYASLPATNDALVVVPIEATGLEADGVLKDYNTLADILSSTNVEQTSMGRLTLTNVTDTIDDTNDWVDIDADDPVWSSATGNAVGAIVVCYDPDTTAGDDTTLVPMSKHDFAVTPNGGDITAVLAVGGFQRAS